MRTNRFYADRSGGWISMAGCRNRARGRCVRSGRGGMVNIWFVMLGLFLIVMMGLSIDVAYSLVVVHQLQNAADASALAGVQQVRFGGLEARLASINLALENRAGGSPVELTDNPTNAAAGEIVIGRWNRNDKVFRPTLYAPNAVKVVTNRTNTSLSGPVQLFFGSIIGTQTVQISRDAIAMIGGGTGAGIIALNPHEKNAFTVSGDATVHTCDGNIQVNSDDPSSAAFLNGNLTVDAPHLNVTGVGRVVGNATLTGDLVNGAPAIPDPLADLPAPSWNPADDMGTVWLTGGENLHIEPGYYSGGILVNNGELTLSPGIYILDGMGLNISGTATFTAEGVMFYVIGTGCVDITGTGYVTITPPNPDIHDYPGSDTYEYISIFQARDNTNESRIIGTSVLNLEGTLYFPAAHLKLGGTGDGFGNQLIADTIEIHGTGDMYIRYDGNEPAVGNKIFLVE